MLQNAKEIVHYFNGYFATYGMNCVSHISGLDSAPDRRVKRII